MLYRQRFSVAISGKILFDITTRSQRGFGKAGLCNKHICVIVWGGINKRKYIGSYCCNKVLLTRKNCFFYTPPSAVSPYTLECVGGIKDVGICRLSN